MSPALIVVGIFVFLTAFWIGRYLQDAKIQPTKAPRPKPLRTAFPSLQASQKAEVEALIRKNERLKAIRLVRKYTGLGLKEAKNLIESLAVKDFSSSQATSISGINPDLIWQLKQLILKNQRIEAIKLLRQQSGLGLKEAKEYIARLNLKN